MYIFKNTLYILVMQNLAQNAHTIYSLHIHQIKLIESNIKPIKISGYSSQ
jgi:hypothetical protein